ncbi:MAG: HEPN domain-containing protein [Deltaproteobacteria bacterium]|nr:HEPN domain-containing protein [Deltaproteobacteria bacterium]
MDEAKKSAVQSWLIKARHDLDSAVKLSQEPDPRLDTAIYHCQQTGEKSLKAFLVYHDQVIEKTHDLRLLVNLSEKLDKQFHDWIDKAALLTPYVAEYRYPGEYLEPDAEEFREALKVARELHAFVLSLLPREVHPSQK